MTKQENTNLIAITLWQIVCSSSNYAIHLERIIAVLENKRDLRNIIADLKGKKPNKQIEWFIKRIEMKIEKQEKRK